MPRDEPASTLHAEERTAVSAPVPVTEEQLARRGRHETAGAGRPRVVLRYADNRELLVSGLVDDRRVLRDFAAVFDQARHEQVARVGVAQDTRGRCAGGMTLMPLRSCSSVTGGVCQTFDLRLRACDLDAGSSLRRVGIVSGAAAGRPVAAIVAVRAAPAARRRTMLDTLKIGPLSHQIARLSV